MKPFLAGLLLVVLVTGCNAPYDFFVPANPTDELDEELRALVVAASEGQGLNYFILPGTGNLAALPQDPRNRLTRDKVELGKLLFHETGLAMNPRRPEGMETYACASCHHAAAGFQSGRIQGVAEGGTGFGKRGEKRVNDPVYEDLELDVQPIRSPSAMNAMYQEVMMWNGRFGIAGPNVGTEALWEEGTSEGVNALGYQALEAQAIAGLKDHRMADIEKSIVTRHPRYIELFERVFPGRPISRETAGLAIAAYERTLLANRGPFQSWLRGNTRAMTDEEKRGAIVFFGYGGCVSCHTGPALNSMTFYALGMPDMRGKGVYGDVPIDEGENIGRASFTGLPEDKYKFKTPQLYNLADSPFLGHGGTFLSIQEVVEYKNAGIAEREVTLPQLPEAFRPLELEHYEVRDLVAFLEDALYDPKLDRYAPKALPSGNCFPVNDPASRVELGCE